MKKIYSTLFLLAIFCSLHAQITITVEAPQANYPSQSLLPSGPAAHNFQKGCFLITASELTALISTNITGFGFKMEKGTASSAVVGNINIYLENTTDVTYSKGTGFSSATFPMSLAYSGPMTIPAGTTTASLIFSIFGGFNYTGGGIYVAYEWSASTAPSANYATYYTNRSNFITGAYRSLATNNPATLNALLTSQYRPVCLIEADNNATNEASVLMIDAPGKVAEAMHTHHIITADIRNSSLGALTNLNVSLNITGANPFTDSQIIPSLAPGAITTVSFAPFTPTDLGLNKIDVYIPNDENPANNSMSWDQEITCNVSANHSPVPTYSTSYGNATFPTACVARFNFNAKSTLRAVDLAIGSDWSTTNAKVYGVLLDNTGAVVAATNTITPLTTVFNTVQTFTFTALQTLTANTDYYIGLAQTKGFYMAATQTVVAPNKFFSTQITGGNLTPFTTAFFGIEPIITGVEISVTQPSTVMCLGKSMVLKANGANNYTWTTSVFNPIANPNDESITVSPNANEIYSVYGEDNAGCNSSGTTFLKIISCVGINENQSAQSINLYPNPSNGKSFVSGLQGSNVLTVYNILGQEVFSDQTSEETATIDLSAQPAGNYLLKIMDSDNNIKTIKLVHQN